MNYLVNPPDFRMANTDLPPFLLKRQIKKLVSALVVWSIAEYYAAINLYTERGDDRTVGLLIAKYSDARVLASHPGFKFLCKFLNDDKIWSSLTRVEQRRITWAYDLIKG